MDIKPIETEYKGYKFRSRLEARWAVFFDEIGAKWEYEPEGYVLNDGTMYLPDFLVHGVRGRGIRGLGYNEKGDIYVEVKGILTQDDLHKVELFPLPIIIFGQIPEAEWIKAKGFWNKNTVQCSLCGNYLDMDGVNGGRGDANYCPNCGADMRGDKNNA